MPKVLSSPSSISSWPSVSLAPVYPWYCQQSDPDKRQLTTLFRPFDGSPLHRMEAELLSWHSGPFMSAPCLLLRPQLSHACSPLWLWNANFRSLSHTSIAEFSCFFSGSGEQSAPHLFLTKNMYPLSRFNTSIPFSMKSSVNLLCIFAMRLCTFLKILSAVLSLSINS